MKLLSILALLTVSVTLVAWRGVDSSVAAQEAAQVEHGRYLVHSVALCVQCHSPRDQAGKLREDRLLRGGQIPFETPWPRDRWAELAPNLHQLLGYTDEEAMTLLTRGLKRDGEPPRGPMPPFRMSESDARSVIAYLRSL